MAQGEGGEGINFDMLRSFMAAQSRGVPAGGYFEQWQRDQAKEELAQREEDRRQQAEQDMTKYRQSLIAAGGCAPIITSRAIPPELPAAKDRTRTPNKSSLCLTPAVAPLIAKTKVPPRSKATSSVFTTICSLTINYLVATATLERLPPLLPLRLPTLDGLQVRSVDCD